MANTEAFRIANMVGYRPPRIVGRAARTRWPSIRCLQFSWRGIQRGPERVIAMTPPRRRSKNLH
jgi:hypothetical protein